MKRKILLSWIFLILSLVGVGYGVWEIFQEGNVSNPSNWLVPIGFLVLSVTGILFIRKSKDER